MRPVIRGHLRADAHHTHSSNTADASAHLIAGGRIEKSGRTQIHARGDLHVISMGEAYFEGDVQKAESSAETWLNAYERYGRACIQRARGRFGIVVINVRSREAWLAVDRFGTCPLAYRATSEELAFADRADAVPGASSALSHQALLQYLLYHAIPSPHTVFSEVNRLPAGHQLDWQGSEARVTPWWSPHFDAAGNDDFEERKEEFLSIVELAVKREANGQRVGAFLSGGTDSSTVSGMLSRIHDEPARTYSIGFDVGGYDEMEYARIAAKHFGTEHHEYYVTPEDLVHGIPEVATHYDQPFGNSSAVPAWICASRAKQDGIEKLLAGDGGDELFAGNTRYTKQRVFSFYEQVPQFLRHGLCEPISTTHFANRIPGLKKVSSYVTQAQVPMPDRLHMYNLLLRLGMTQVLTPEFLAGVDTAQPMDEARAIWKAPEGAGLVNRMLAYDWKYTLADNDLPKVIGTADLAGLGVGFPLLNDALLDFSMRLPVAWKIKGFKLRWFFKEALRGFLPDAILTKKKHGFGLPFGVWACEHAGLRSLATDTLVSLKSRGIVRPDFIDPLLRELLPAHPGYYGELVWILMTLEHWLNAHDHTVSDETTAKQAPTLQTI